MNFVSDHRLLGGSRRLLGSALIAVLALASTVLVAGAPDEKRITVYSVAANYSLPVSEQSGKDYVGLLEILEPLGTVSAKAGGNHWKLLYNDAQCEFTSGKKAARIRGRELNLPANFVLQNNRGLVTISSLGTLLPRILGGPITLNEAARRVFVGNVGVHFTAEVVKNNPPKLVLNFTSPVNPTIATEPGKLHLEFMHEAVVAPGSQLLTFDSNAIPSASFQEKNGAAELSVNSTVPLMATFSNDGRTITVAPPSALAASAQNKPPSPASAPAPVTMPGAAPTTAAAPAPVAAIASGPHYFAVIDASHGGDERGAALTEQMAEKDITLSIARSLRQELMARGLATMMVRDADVTLTADQRAGTADASGASIYLCIHASSEGRGVRLYTALLPPGGENHGPFVDWDTAQSPFLQASQTAENEIAQALKAKDIPVRGLAAPLRPLNNVAFAAVAIEVAPSTGDIAQLSSSSYEQQIAAAVATGVANIRDKLKVESK